MGSAFIGSNEPVAYDGDIDRRFFEPGHVDPGEGFGFTGRDDNPFGRSFDVPLIPRSEWEGRIKAIEAAGLRNSDRLRRAGYRIKNQRSTSYCWVFAGTSAVEAARIAQGDPHISLSPASVGCLVKNYQNRGGWSGEAARKGSESGWVPSALWPDHAISREYDTPASRQQREGNRLDDWYDLGRNFDAVMTLLLSGRCVSVGFNWWRHEVLACDPLFSGSQFGYRIANSWGEDWGEDGFGVLLGQKAVPDNAMCPVLTTPR